MDLITIERRELNPGEEADTVNARDLWKFMESRRSFSNWIHERIDRYGLLYGEDYLVNKFVQQVPHEGGVRNATMFDYYLTIETAKELAMVENNDKGREIRRYFIECERRAKAAAVAPVAAPAAPFDVETLLGDPAAVVKLISGFAQQVIDRDQKIAEQAPKVAALQRIAEWTDGALCITDAAKVLQVNPKMLFTWLQGHDWIYRRQSSHWIAYQPRLKQGYLEHKLNRVQRKNLDGILEDKIVEQVRITPKGMAYLSTVFCTVKS